MLKTAEEKVTKSGVGVVVGRFQVSELTEGHKSLLSSVQERHDKLIIVVGLSPIKATKNNPLDYETRRRMLSSEYPMATIVYLEDDPDDHVWSKNLTRIVERSNPPRAAVTMYGSRDSFQSHYDGPYPTKELLQEVYTSGTKERERLSFITPDTKSFRQGVVWATQQRFPTSYQTVDAAIYCPSTKRILLGKKNIDGGLFRFIGGFVEPNMDCSEDYLENNISREVREESGIEIGDISYVCSMGLDDWRYRSEEDSITTVLFECIYVFGTPKPNDDIDGLQWFDIPTISKEYKTLLVPEHIKLMKKYLQFLDKKKKSR